MQRRSNLRSYGLNLLGSLAGRRAHLRRQLPVDAAGRMVSACRSSHYSSSTRGRHGSLIVGVATAVTRPRDSGLACQSPVAEGLLAVSASRARLTRHAVSWRYAPRVTTISASTISRSPKRSTPRRLRIRNYYDLPYRRLWFADGCCRGRAPAAAMTWRPQCDRAARIDAIEIDPAIMAAGKAAHPEHPYDQRQVRAIVNDARTFLQEQQLALRHGGLRPARFAHAAQSCVQRPARFVCLYRSRDSATRERA